MRFTPKPPVCLYCRSLIEVDDVGLIRRAVRVNIPGGFGSSVYDPGDSGREHLSAYLCDPCLTALITDEIVERVQVHQPRPTYIYSTYELETDDQPPHAPGAP